MKNTENMTLEEALKVAGYIPGMIGFIPDVMQCKNRKKADEWNTEK